MGLTVRVATRKGLFTLTDDGGRWRVGPPAFLGDPVVAVLDDARDGSLHAALNLGHFGVKLHRSGDGGRSWQEMTAPVYPPQPESAEGPPWKLALLWTLEAGTVAEPGVLWAGTIPGGLFRSTDHGASWSLVRALWDRPERLKWLGGGYDSPGIHSIMVDPRDGRRVTVAVSCGGVWRTDDGGDSWRNVAQGMRADFMPPDQVDDADIQDPHRVVASAADPDSLWCQHHCGIFHRSAGADTWRQIDTAAVSDFGFAVAVHPKDSSTAWFVPAESDQRRVPVREGLAVTRTRDGGGSFETLRRGLPQEACYDLVYRHGLDVDNSGNVLAMGSTTGNLWLSRDQGDTWELACGTLPPIYAVRFASGQ